MFFLGLNDSKLACIPRGRLLAWLVALGVAGTVSAAQNSRAENAFYSDQQGHSGREHRAEIEADLTTDQENNIEWLEDQVDDFRQNLWLNQKIKNRASDHFIERGMEFKPSFVDTGLV